MVHIKIYGVGEGNLTDGMFDVFDRLIDKRIDDGEIIIDENVHTIEAEISRPTAKRYYKELMVEVKDNNGKTYGMVMIPGFYYKRS